MKFYFDTEHNTIVSQGQIIQEYTADHRLGESIYDRIQNSLVCNGGTLVELPGNFVHVDTAKESVSEFVSLDDARAVIKQLSDEDLQRLFVQVEYHRRIESLQEITEKIRNYVTARGSFWLENIIDDDGRVSFRDIADAIGYEISHLKRSIGE